MAHLVTEDARATISTRLHERRSEIEEAVLTRVYSLLADPPSGADAEYDAGLRLAVSAALDYGIAIIERGSQSAPPIPPVLLVQARVAARSGISLDMVLRRYFAGQSLLLDFVIEEAKSSEILDGEDLQRLLRAEAALFERLLAAISEEHARESEDRLGSVEEKRAEQIERLLAGDFPDASRIAYDFDSHHLGILAKGTDAALVLRELARSLDRQLLLVYRGDATVWAWLGGRLPLEPANLEGLLAKVSAEQVCFALGEPAEGLPGWRLTHRQARAALPVAARHPQGFARYADVALLASVIQDDLLTTSLRQLFLSRLDCERDGGVMARETLRAYFAAGRNGASAAATLGVSRQTVTNRLRAIEARIGRSLDSSAPELELSLRFEDFSHTSNRLTDTAETLDDVEISPHILNI